MLSSKLQIQSHHSHPTVSLLAKNNITECIEYEFLSLTYIVLTTNQHFYLHYLITVQPPCSTCSFIFGHTHSSIYIIFSMKKTDCFFHSGVVLKMEVGIRKGAWQRDWRYPAYLWSLRWVYAVKKPPEVGIRRIPVYTPQYTTVLPVCFSSSLESTLGFSPSTMH